MSWRKASLFWRFPDGFMTTEASQIFSFDDVKVDPRTGEVFNPPLAVDGTLFMPFLVIGESVGGNPELEFRANSRLMIISATPNWLKPHARSYRHYFVWESNQWRLVHRESLD